MNTNKRPPLGPEKSLLWMLVAVGCFNLAYEWVSLPEFGLLILGYALALVRLTHQATARRAFYFGLATAYLCYAPQLRFMWNIFGPAAFVLWLILAAWVGLFSAIICAAARRWGQTASFWLVPVVWTGVEYFRSELYYLRFSWMNIGYVLPPAINLGMYGSGFLVFAITTIFFCRKQFAQPPLGWRIKAIAILALICICGSSVINRNQFNGTPTITGIQLEFANDYIIGKSLDKALKKYPATAIFVLSEYTLDGAVPERLEQWCREHGKFLVVGGKEHLTNDNFYNTAYVVGTNGGIVFQQAKSVPIQFFRDGLPAPTQKVWDSPWGKIGICICYDLSYTRVTDELIRQGAQLLIVPTMDVAEWGRHQHELHSRVAPTRAAEYGVPIFRLASSGISQAVDRHGAVLARTAFPGSGDMLSAQMRLARHGTRPLDRWLAPLCVGVTGLVLASLLWRHWREGRKGVALEP